MCVCVFYLKAFHETLTQKLCPRSAAFSADNAGFVYVWRKRGRQKGRGRKKLPTYSIKGTNNGGELVGTGGGRRRNAVFL